MSNDAVTAKELVTDALAALDNPADAATFACRSTLPAETLALSVKGFGELRWPVAATRVKKLFALTRPAPFGKGRETLHDPSVRDVGEVSPRQLGLDRRAWNLALKPALDDIRETLGLPAGRLTAKVDKLLVYGPGQFFKPHRDTERADDMIGTLVVVLPSHHKGGSLSVSHLGETRRFVTRSSTSPKLTLYAFYATCEHEVRPVTEGHRIVLSHTLHFRASEANKAVEKPVVDERLRHALAELFEPSTRPTGSFGRSMDKLVYLLDHPYSQRSLGWRRMKGDDRVRAEALHTAASELGLQAHLALINVSETWSASVDEPRYYRRGRGGGRGYRTWQSDDDEWDDEDDGADEDQGSKADTRAGNTLVAEAEYELEELIERGASLEHWRDSADRSVELPALGTHDDELCWTVSLDQHTPEFEEYEGYMGNYGNTLQREYRRAAVVLWSARDRYRILASSDMGGQMVLRELTSDAESLGPSALQAAVESLLDAWPGQQRANEPGVLRDALALAGQLDSHERIIDLLQSTSISSLKKREISMLLDLGSRHGKRFCQQLFDRWLAIGEPVLDHRARFEKRTDQPRGRWFLVEPDADRLQWLPGFADFCRAVHSSSATVWNEVPASCFDALLELLRTAHDEQHLLASPRARVRHAEQERLDILALLDAAIAIGDASRLNNLLDVIDAGLEGYHSAVPIFVLERLNEEPTLGKLKTRRKGLHKRVCKLIDQRISEAERPDGDWRIDVTPRCQCADCRTLTEFLQSTDSSISLPLAKDRRRHLHAIIEGLEIPVSHSTRREGRPFVLELRKRQSMFKEAARRVEEERAMAARLTSMP